MRRAVYCGLLLLVLFLVGVYVGLLTRQSPLVFAEWKRRLNLSRSFADFSPTPFGATARYLSYQPPGNGWNNQRIALENALVLARLLNRTLLVHPLSPHRLGEQLKMRLPHGHHYGYLAYNMMNASSLLPLSQFIDLELMSHLVPVQEVRSPHPQFLRDYSHLQWRRVCHSVGWGYWVDQRPSSEQEKSWLTQQQFTPNKAWREKCHHHDPSQVARFVSDLYNDSSEMLYFEEGTLFGVQIRFASLQGALSAQQWVLHHVQYSQAVKRVAATVRQRLGAEYNAMHIRRVGHINKKISREQWLNDMLVYGFTPDVPVYIATDETDLDWFQPLHRAGFKLYFAANFTDLLSFPQLPPALRQDMLGIHEQVICQLAQKFVPSMSSTFAAFIRRQRGEVDMVDGLYTDTLHTTWIKHTAINHSK